MPRPVESAAGRGFAPGPSPALARRKTPHFVGPRPQSAVPHWRCTGARVVSRWGGRCCASILPPPRTPALDKEAPAGPCPHCRRSRAGSFRRQRPGSRQSRQPRLRRLHSAVRLRRVYLYLPAIPPHLRRGEPRRKCSGRAGGSRSSTAPVGAVFPGLRPRALSLRFSVVTGPVGPDPGGRLCPHTAGLCRRPGAWGLPSVVPSKPVIPHALMLQTASGATLHSLRSFRAIGGL